MSYTNYTKFYPYILFGVLFLLYILTASPDLMFTDSGELAAVCATLGIAHPSGYPLFSILGYLWTLIPLPTSTIYSLNIFAGFLTSLSSVFLYLSSILLLTYISRKIYPKNPINKNSIKNISLATALTYGTGLIIWEQGIAVEVYSLHLLLINMCLFFLLKAVLEENTQKYYYLAAFVFGLAMTNHLTSILIIPAILLFLLKKPKEVFDFSSNNIKFILTLFIPFFIGLSLYIYLPLRSAGLPEFDWGGVSRGFDKFLYHVQGKQYQVWMFTGSEVWGENFGKLFKVLPYQFAFIGLIPVIIGFFVSYKASRTLALWCLLLIIVCIFYAINYSIHDIDSYFVIAYIGLTYFLAIGLMQLAKKYPKILLTFMFLPLINIVLNYQENDHSNNYLVKEYTRITIDNLEPNAIIISAQWDYWNSAFWYKQKVENVREDILLVEKELLRRTWYPLQLQRWHPELKEKCGNEIDSFMEVLELFESKGQYDYNVIQTRFEDMLNCFIDSFYDERPIYITLDIMQTEPNIAKDYIKVPQGFAFKLTKSNNYIQTKPENIDITKFIKSGKNKSGHLVEGIYKVASMNFINLARYEMGNNNMKAAQIAAQKAFQLDNTNIYASEILRRLQ